MSGAFVGALQLVPWGKVIENLPTMIDAARNLRKAIVPARKQLTEAVKAETEANNPTEIAAKIDAIEQALVTINSQLDDASSLIAAMAEASSQVVLRARRLERLLYGVGVVAVSALSIAIVAWIK